MPSLPPSPDASIGSIARITLIVLLSMLLSSVSNARNGKPNILFILADDLGIGGLHCYGTEYLETPNIDSLAAEGMRFTGGLAAFPTCKPSRAAILTGQYAPRTGVYRVVDRHTGQEDKIRFLIPENEDVSLQKILINQPFKEAGYATAAYGKWHISNPLKAAPTEYGFDRAIESHSSHYHAKSVPETVLPEGKMIEELFTDEAIDFMEDAASKEQPFFLYMPYFLVHRPLEAKKAYLEHFNKKFEGMNFIGNHPEEMAVIAAMTRMLDDEVGRLLAAVKRLGQEEDTIIVFASDNGSFNENLVGHFRGQKGETYEGGLRVPYIFKWKGKIKPASIVSDRITGVDLYPTFLSLASLQAPSDYPLDGYDLSSLLLGQRASIPSREVFCYFPKYARYNEKTRRWAESWRNVIYHGDYKLIEYPEYNESELFNLAADPQETTNLIETHPEQRQELARRLARWLKAIDAPVLTPNPDYSL